MNTRAGLVRSFPARNTRPPNTHPRDSVMATPPLEKLGVRNSNTRGRALGLRSLSSPLEPFFKTGDAESIRLLWCLFKPSRSLTDQDTQKRYRRMKANTPMVCFPEHCGRGASGCPR
ncbi:hypothetical protein SRHO_G00166930 [Serrasalmus rhombeus]